MKDRKTLIALWSEKLYNSGLTGYQSKKNAILIANQMEELNSQLSGSNAGNVWVKALEEIANCISNNSGYLKELAKRALAQPITPIKSNDVGDVEMFFQRNIQNPYPSDSQSYTAFKKGFELGWQSKQQPINPITIKNFITMVKNSDAEIKKLVTDELGVEQKEPVSDAIEFAEWLSGEGYQQYDCNERWIAPHNNNNVYLTKELYEQFKSLQPKQN